MRLTLPAVAALLSAITVTAQVQSPSAEAGRITGHVVTGYAELVADATVTLLGRPNDQGLRRTDQDRQHRFLQLCGVAGRQLPALGHQTGLHQPAAH